ncbi:hypothetical protein Dimus_036223, partial [Dionaea muscipula]
SFLWNTGVIRFSGVNSMSKEYVSSRGRERADLDFTVPPAYYVHLDAFRARYYLEDEAYAMGSGYVLFPGSSCATKA